MDVEPSCCKWKGANNDVKDVGLKNIEKDGNMQNMVKMFAKNLH